MRPAVLYILYAKSSYEQTGNVITFSQFEEGNLVENGLNAEKEKSISGSIDESSTVYDSDDGTINTNSLEVIQYGSQIHP